VGWTGLRGEATTVIDREPGAILMTIEAGPTTTAQLETEPLARNPE